MVQVTAKFKEAAFKSTIKALHHVVQTPCRWSFHVAVADKREKEKEMKRIKTELRVRRAKLTKGDCLVTISLPSPS